MHTPAPPNCSFLTNSLELERTGAIAFLKIKKSYPRRIWPSSFPLGAARCASRCVAVPSWVTSSTQSLRICLARPGQRVLINSGHQRLDLSLHSLLKLRELSVLDIQYLFIVYLYLKDQMHELDEWFGDRTVWRDSTSQPYKIYRFLNHYQLVMCI